METQVNLTRGAIAIVDKASATHICSFRWQLDNNGYAKRRDGTLMHRLIMGCVKGDGKKIDHKDHDKLNNRLSNLRFATQSENQKNKKSRGTSKYLGVHKITTRGYSYWRAAINSNGKIIKLGTFPLTEEGEKQAAETYDRAAKQYHKEFANLNFKN
tara:strand:+ start:399 stop:869 length:471 start_codon:yes stop_codon:yes gene_type:complete